MCPVTVQPATFRRSALSLRWASSALFSLPLSGLSVAVKSLGVTARSIRTRSSAAGPSTINKTPAGEVRPPPGVRQKAASGATSPRRARRGVRCHLTRLDWLAAPRRPAAVVGPAPGCGIGTEPAGQGAAGESAHFRARGLPSSQPLPFAVWLLPRVDVFRALACDSPKYEEPRCLACTLRHRLRRLWDSGGSVGEGSWKSTGEKSEKVTATPWPGQYRFCRQIVLSSSLGRTGQCQILVFFRALIYRSIDFNWFGQLANLKPTPRVSTESIDGSKCVRETFLSRKRVEKMRRVLIEWWCAVLLAMAMSMAGLCVCEPILSDRTVRILDDDEEFPGRRHSLVREVAAQLADDLPQWVGKESFILTDYLPDGELERRISFNGITAKETSIGSNSSKTLSLWQVSDGARFIQLIYSSVGDLIDCEYVRQKGLVSNFLHKFYKEIDMARARNFTSPYVAHARPSIISNHEFNRYIANNEIPEDYYAQPDEDQLEDAFGMRNLTYHRIEQYEDIPYDTRQWLNYNDLKIKCKERHRQMKKIVQGLNSKDEKTRRNATHHVERKKRDLLDFLMVPNTKWCGRGHQAANYKNLGGASRADKCCRKHDHCKLNIQAMTTKWQLFNYLPFTISHCSCDTRQRRDLSSLLRVPGTKWCGKGWSAKKYSDLGGYSKADRCCRQHDKSCPFWITGFETKYGLYNWRVSTLMHCKCDERFRTCLKMADSSDASMVGKIFFNIVQTKCFVLKAEKVCKKRSWWGKCEKNVLRKRAHLRDNRKF